MDIFLETTFRLLRGAAILIFLHALQTDPGYLAHPPTGTGVPPKKINRENLKFGLKLIVYIGLSLDNSGLVGISSPKFSRRRGELWSTNEKGIYGHKY